MELITVILLILLGVILLLVEFLLLPGITIAGIGSVLSLIVGVVLSFKYWGNLAGIIVLLSVVVFIPVLLYLLFKGKAMRPIILSSDIDGVVKTIDEQAIHVGDVGETVGRLAPMGRSKINGISVETRSVSGYLDSKTKVRVIKIEGNTVIVEPIKE